MPADASVYNAVQPVKIQSPQEFEAARLDQKLAVDARRQKLQAAQDDQAIRGVLQQYAGDPEGAITALQRVSPSAAAGYQELLTKQRKAALDQTKSELDILKSRTEQGLSMMQRARTFKSLGMYRAAVNMLATDDEDRQSFPQELPDDATFDRILQGGMSIKEQNDAHEKALEHYVKGDKQKGFALSLLAAGDDPEAWQEAVQAGAQMGVGKALVQSFAQPSPENIARAQALTTTAAEKESSRHNQAMEASATTDDARMAAAQSETLRHNRAMEGQSAAELAFRKSEAAKGKTAAGKEATQAEILSAGYAKRVEQAESTLETVQKDIADMGLLSFAAQSRMPAKGQSGKFQQYDQASRNFINAVLRRESGAAISPSEFDNARRQYLPQPGDTKETLELKKQNRASVFSTFKQAGGSAYTPTEAAPPKATPKVGDVKAFPNGRKGKWDGHGWELVQ